MLASTVARLSAGRQAPCTGGSMQVLVQVIYIRWQLQHWLSMSDAGRQLFAETRREPE